MTRALFFALLLLGSVAQAEQIHRHDDGTHIFPGKVIAGRGFLNTSTAFAALPSSPTAGQTIYCSNCNVSSPCVPGGTGATATYRNGQWECSAVPSIFSALAATAATGAAGQDSNLAGQAGQGTNGSTGQFGGAGGSVFLTAGNGGSAPVGSANGSGGNVTISAGVPGAGGGTAGTEGTVALFGRQVLLTGLWGSGVAAQGVILTSDNQAITVTASTIALTSDNVTATNRTFTLSAPPSGGLILLLRWDDATNLGELLDAGNVNLTATWPPATPMDATLLLISDAGGQWVEIARSDPTP